MTVRRFVLGLLSLGLFVLVAVPSPLRAQSVELLYDKGGLFSGEKYVSIDHADAEGGAPPDTAAVRAADRVYFAFRTKGDWAFEEEDRDPLRRIDLIQDTVALAPETVRFVGGEDPQTALVGMKKTKVDWLQPVAFRHEVDTSRGLALKEVYAPGYAPLRQAYDEGRRRLDADTPLRAVEVLRPFYKEVEPAFTLVDKAQALLDTAATESLIQAQSRFRPLRKELVSEPDVDGLARLDSFRVQLDSIQAILTPYLKARPSAGQDVKTRLETLRRSADQLYANARSTYRQKTLLIFMRGTYESSKLRLYLDVLTQMLIDRASAFTTAGLQVDSLRLSLLETPRFAESRRQLQEQGWAAEFREVVALLNENIRERREVFGDEIMESLRLRRPAAPQPYYEIAAAMNALLADDRIQFSRSWNRALEKVADVAVLEEMQRWRLASRLPPEAMPDRARRLAKEARAFWRRGELGDAEDRLALAARLADGYAPLYDELGQVQLARGDTSGARSNYARARERAASYAPPEVRRLRLLLAQEKYKQALTRADSLLQEQSYWLFYFPKARALVGLERYNEALPVLRGRCEPLNDESYALYAVLAKIYAEMGTWEGARWAVKEAKALSPRRPSFEELVADVRAKAKKEGVTLEETEGDSTRAGER